MAAVEQLPQYIDRVVPSFDPWNPACLRGNIIVTTSDGRVRIYFNVSDAYGNDWNERCDGIVQRIGGDASLLGRIRSIPNIQEIQINTDNQRKGEILRLPMS